MDMQTQLAEKDRIIATQQQQLNELTDQLENIKALSQDVINDSFEKEDQLKIRTAECTKYMNANAQLKRQIQELRQTTSGPDTLTRIQALQEEKEFMQGLIGQLEDEKAENVKEFEKKISFFQIEKEKLQNSVLDLESRIEQTAELEQKVLVVTKNNDMLLQEKRNLQQKLLELEHRAKDWGDHDQYVASLQKEIQELEGTRDNLQKKLRNAEDSIKDLSKFKTLSATLKDEKDEIIRKQTSELKGVEGDLQRQINSLQSEKTELLDKLDTIEEKYKAASRKITNMEALQAESSSFLDKLERQEAEIEKLKAQLKSLDSIVENAQLLQEAKLKLTDENRQFQQKISQLEQDISVCSQYKGELDELREKNAKLTVTLERYQGKSSRVIELEDQTKNLMQLNQQLEDQLSALQKGDTTPGDSIIELRRQNKELNAQNIRILRENSTLKDQLSQRQTSEEQLRIEITSELKKDITASKGKLAQTIATSEDQAHQISGLTELNRSLQKENSDYKQEISKMKKALAEMAEIKSGFDSLKEINFKLEDTKDTLTKEVKTLRREVRDLTITADNFVKLKETYQNLETSHRELENTNRSFKVQLMDMENLKEGFDSLKKLNTDLEDENREIKKQLSTAQRELDRFIAANFETRVKNLEARSQELQDTIKFKENELSVKD
ncbi:MAG: hypothetical protein HWN66_20560, partial [Candidatus Helarchaeota archaeon]|nr:hypothetical protein [Candidatus Helarchaeota archaeon]